MTSIANGLGLYVVFLISTTIHEAAHGWAALIGGDPTAHSGGLVTLDPIPHIRRSPVGMVVLPLLSTLTIGWPLGFASTPYDPHWAEQHQDRSALMALAGPGSNLLLALVSGVLINLGLFAGVFAPPTSISFVDVTTAAQGAGPGWQVAAWILGAFFALNTLLLLFNLLPVPPLDGSQALVLLLPERAAAGYRRFLNASPALSLIGIFIAWQVFDVVFNPVFTWALNTLYAMHGVVYS